MIDRTRSKENILCIGEILWDMLPTGAKAGGAPMNVALHLKKFGLDVRFAGRIGNDQLGRDLAKFLKSQNLDISLLQVDPNLPTSTVQVHLADDHSVRFEIVDNVAWDRIELTNDLIAAAKEATVIIYGTLASRHAFTRTNILELLENKCLKLLDVNLRKPFDSREVVEKLLSRADIVKLNDDELNVISGWHGRKGDLNDLTKWFAGKFGCNTICVTRGDKGALIYDQGTIIEHPGYKIDVVDTVGSGDAFLAGFLAKYLAGELSGKSLEYACATGALVATKAGGTPDYQLNEIIKIIKPS